MLWFCFIFYGGFLWEWNVEEAESYSSQNSTIDPQLLEEFWDALGAYDLSANIKKTVIKNNTNDTPTKRRDRFNLLERQVAVYR